MCATAIHPERLKTLYEIPGLMSGGGALLYIGARLPDGLRGVPELRRAGYAVSMLEIWPENARQLREAGWEVVRGDVREAGRVLGGRMFDVIFWWHGPEHVEKAELAGVIAGLKQITGRILITGCPWGRYEQAEERGNPHERHVSHLYPDDLLEAGMSEARTCGVADSGYPSQVTAWWLRNETELP